MKFRSRSTDFYLTIIIPFVLLISHFQARPSTVRAILFYSPTCPHCQKVIVEDLSPLVERYGDQLVIFAINIGTEQGYQLFIEAVEYFGIPLDQAGVPMLVASEMVMMGSLEIPEKFPGLIEEGLSSGGVNWPEIPVLIEFLRAQGYFVEEEKTILEAEEQGISSAPAEPQNSMPEVIDQSSHDEMNILSPVERFQQDVLGNSLSLIVLLGMVYSLIYVFVSMRGNKRDRKPWPKLVFVLLVIVGIIVSNYLSFIEITRTEAVCGPVGNCNVVQQSPYAYLFGVIPVGLLGFIGYCLIGIFWLVSHVGSERFKKVSTLILFGLTGFGSLFSIYLTFLEPFVIGASCAWCLTSAVVITLMFLYVSNMAGPFLKQFGTSP